MDNLISTTGLSGLVSPSDGVTTTGPLPAVVGEQADSKGFSAILSEQGVSAEIIEKLKGFLPEGQLKKLESLFADGKLLPQVAEVAAKIEAILAGKGLTPEVLEQLQALIPEQKQGQLKAIFWGNKPMPSGEEAPAGAELGELGAAVIQPTDPQGITPALVGAVASASESPQKQPVMLEGKQEGSAQALPRQLQLREAPLATLPIATPAEGLQAGEKLLPEMIRQFLARGEGVDKPVVSAAQKNPEDESLSPLIKGSETTFNQGRLPAAVADRNILELPLAATGIKIAPVLPEGVPQLISGSVSLPLVNHATPAVQRSEVPLPINTPPGSNGWDSAVGDRILWMVGQKSQSASIRINPPHLGPIEVHVTVQKDQASVNFTALHGVVRDALETAIPRLREMFNDNNLQLVNVDVSQKDAGEQRSLQNFSGQPGGDGEQLSGADGGQVEHSGGEDEALIGIQELNMSGRVDYYI
ncbi:MAG: flagellar hook-length control protein FliK [Sedimenticola sp.]